MAIPGAKNVDSRFISNRVILADYYMYRGFIYRAKVMVILDRHRNWMLDKDVVTIITGPYE